MRDAEGGELEARVGEPIGFSNAAPLPDENVLQDDVELAASPSQVALCVADDDFDPQLVEVEPILRGVYDFRVAFDADDPSAGGGRKCREALHVGGSARSKLPHPVQRIHPV